MRKLPCILIGLLWLALSGTATASPQNLTILVDGDLTLPLSTIARDYSRTHALAVQIVSTAGHDVEQQLAQGLEAQILITSDTRLLNALNARGLVDVFTKQSVASTRLALVSARQWSQGSGFANRIAATAMLYAHPEYPLYVVPESTPDGVRARQFLQSDAFPARIEQHVTTVASYQAMEALLRDQPSFALMPATHALQNPALRVLSLIPAEMATVINYQAVLIGGGDKQEIQPFIDYLTSPAAAQPLSHYGFQPAQK